MKRLFTYIHRYWNWYAFGMVATLIASACAMTVSYLSGAAINTIQSHHAQTFSALARMEVNVSAVEFQFGAILTAPLATDHNGIEPGTINLMASCGQLVQVTPSQECERSRKTGV